MNTVNSIMNSDIDVMTLEDKIILIEKTLKSIRKDLANNQDMHKAAREMQIEYNTDPELTEFTALDAEDFYETR